MSDESPDTGNESLDAGSADTRRVSRRRALQVIGTGSAVALAGCTQGGDPCDLSISKTHSGETVTYGGTTEFEIAVCNEGDQTCTDPVTVTDALPLGTTFDSVGGTGWTATASGTTVTCEHPNANGLGAGDCLPTLVLTITVGGQSEVGPEIANCASLGDVDENLTNNRDCVKVPVESPPGECDLSISKTYEGEAVTAGSTATFQIEVCNDGDGPCEEPVTVVDPLPAGVSFDAGAGTGWSVGETNGVVTATHQNAGGLAPGACLPTIELTVQVGSTEETGDQIRNCASVESEDANGENDRDCVTVPVLPGEGECDLAIEKTHAGGDVVAAGSTTTFDVLVCNEGDGDCDGPVTVTDDLPDGLAFVSASGTGWSASETNGVVTATHQNVGDLPAGSCLPTLTLTVDVGSVGETGDQVRNCAVVETDDASAENDRDCAVVTVTPPVDGCTGLTIEKEAATQFTYGEQEQYEITVCNPTATACDGQVVVTDDLPGGISYVSHSGSGWSISVSGGVVTATHPNNGALSPGGCLPTLTLTVAVVPAAQFPGGSDAVQNCAQLVVDGAVVDESCVTHVITNV
jgi:uncharacterized repeat protein (TIGR01451 family)